MYINFHEGTIGDYIQLKFASLPFLSFLQGGPHHPADHQHLHRRVDPGRGQLPAGVPLRLQVQTVRPLGRDALRHARRRLRPRHPQVAGQPAHLRAAADTHQGGSAGRERGKVVEKKDGRVANDHDHDQIFGLNCPIPTDPNQS